MKKIISAILIVLVFNSCEQIQNTLSNTDIVNGLKEALNIGTGNSVNILGVENGFFADQAVKILLPEEIRPVLNIIQHIPGGTNLVNNTILALNRSAEDAVKEAVPIFTNAITSMNIHDGMAILTGSNNEATQYLHRNTYSQLTNAFAPKVNHSLSKPLIAGISTEETYRTLAVEYNKVANSVIGNVLGLETVSESIGEYVTEKTLDGLFSKIAVEEEKIRTDVNARTTSLLKRVFGQLD